MDPSRLLGTWRFRREVNDHRDGGTFLASGEAEFTGEPDGRIRWVEHGTLRWADHSAPVTRTLFLTQDRLELSADDCPTTRHEGPSVDDGSAGHDGTSADGDSPADDGSPRDDDGPGARWRVTFEDGRDFHPWTAQPVEHPCGEDLYRGCVQFPGHAPAHWTVRWRVTGPAKDYTLVSYYTASRTT